ncbi:helix-turn-helix transcriptional regulator [Comamonas sp. JUb58]|uniref:helix-turn-helix domain-containing protein n=1 Tax=Comamonas sp. JUb58 TaxID=2485114 RepID=UPI001060B575|nr:helix-turn-helix transcriptional regulator [Comamonas sp. JUb58]
MHNLKPIRQLLGVTQRAMAEGLGCTQGNIGNYEKGQTLPPDAARNLIAFSATLGLVISYDHIYGGALLPKRKEVAHG